MDEEIPLPFVLQLLGENLVRQSWQVRQLQAKVDALTQMMEQLQAALDEAKGDEDAEARAEGKSPQEGGSEESAPADEVGA